MYSLGRLLPLKCTNTYRNGFKRLPKSCTQEIIPNTSVVRSLIPRGTRRSLFLSPKYSVFKQSQVQWKREIPKIINIRQYAHSSEVSYMAKVRRGRIYRFIAYITIAATVVYVLFSVLEDKFMYYYTPSQAFEMGVDTTQKFRLGGVVVPGSVKTVPGTIAINFILTDFNIDIDVTYTGLVPDLFREGQGCVCEGVLKEDGRFYAEVVLAKHDESYIPGDIAEEIQRTLKEKEDMLGELNLLMNEEEKEKEGKKEEEDVSLSETQNETSDQKEISGWQKFGNLVGSS